MTAVPFPKSTRKGMLTEDGARIVDVFNEPLVKVGMAALKASDETKIADLDSVDLSKPHIRFSYPQHQRFSGTRPVSTERRICLLLKADRRRKGQLWELALVRGIGQDAGLPRSPSDASIGPIELFALAASILAHGVSAILGRAKACLRVG